MAIAYVGLTAVGFGVGKLKQGSAKREERRRLTKLAWEDYGAVTREIAETREQQERFFATDISSARAKMAAGGIMSGSQHWQGQLERYRTTQAEALAEIDERERKYLEESELFQFAKRDYEQFTSVSEISRSVGLKGDIVGAAQVPDRYQNFTYEGYDFSNPNIPGYKGKRDYDLTMTGISSYDMDMTNNPAQLAWVPGSGAGFGNPSPGIARRPDYVSQGYYEATRPTLDEFYWINYSGDEEKAQGASRDIRNRRAKYLEQYGSPIALGPYTE